ncbi:hypothetical protein AV530_000901 [Patagioenas fasciata monilis]|uniref:Uncharacterized protein n=1 Tax=Patagioenas fasciata monilis TaxID=372326 RepID=A0A1V4KSM5_PATFA|nr:hypothetical protein AV530_000901 [Patagioenas fasciata monilis]
MEPLTPWLQQGRCIGEDEAGQGGGNIPEKVIKTAELQKLRTIFPRLQLSDASLKGLFVLKSLCSTSVISKGF